MHDSIRVQVDHAASRDEAEAIWQKRRKEPGVISCCFLLHSDEQVTPKMVYQEVWHVHTVYHGSPT